jgi:hypothetical protein
MKKSKLAGCFIGIFLCGAITGWVASQAAIDRQRSRIIDEVRDGKMTTIAEVVMKGMSKRLSLSDTQALEVKSHLDIAISKVLAIRRSHRPEIELVVKDFLGSVEQVLEPEQMTKLQEAAGKYTKGLGA